MSIAAYKNATLMALCPPIVTYSWSSTMGQRSVALNSVGLLLSCYHGVRDPSDLDFVAIAHAFCARQEGLGIVANGLMCTREN